MKRTLAVAAAVAALLSAAPGAAQAAPADKELCKSGGFANYVDPTTDLPFKNQGRCVSFVNGGGVLVPVEDEPPVAIFPTAKLAVGDFADGTFPVTVEVQGSPNTTYSLETFWGETRETRSVTTNADGLASFTVDVIPGSGFTVSYQRQALAQTLTPAAPIEEVAVNAGPDQAVSLSEPLFLDGTATGMPIDVRYHWQTVSGPGIPPDLMNMAAAQFRPADPNWPDGDVGHTLDTTAFFSTPGVYVLRLTAEDGNYQSLGQDMVEVTVSE